MKEKLIQQAVMQALRCHENMGGCYFIRNNSFAGHIQRSNGSKGYIKNNKPGTPDIVLCYEGRFIALEIKSSSGRQTPSQREAEGRIKMAGGEYYVIRSVDELIEILK